MAAVILWGWDTDASRYRKILVDSSGKLIISDADPFEITQTTPEDLRHVPHGYYAAGLSYLPLAVDANGVLRISEEVRVVAIIFIIDGGGSAITTGQKGHLEIPFACALTAWTLVSDVAGAIVIDVWKDTYANFPPTDADAMPGAGKEPTIAATNQKAQDTDISDWASVAVAAGDVLAFNVDSCTTITRVTLSLKATKT